MAKVIKQLVEEFLQETEKHVRVTQLHNGTLQDREKDRSYEPFYSYFFYSFAILVDRYGSVLGYYENQ